MTWLPEWVLKRQDERFLQALLDGQIRGTLDEITDRQVVRVLLKLRFVRAVEPYLQIFKLTWEFINGRYRAAYSKIRGGAHQASGTGAGAAGQPVAQSGAGYASPPAYTPFAAAGGASGPVGPANPSASPPRYFEDAGIIAGEVTAYRCWRLKQGKLWSVFQEHFCWEPGQIVTGDVAIGDGVYAFKSVLLMAQYGMYRDGSDIIVTGTVDLWGEVFEHERGYRASHACVASIDDSPDYDAEALRRLYGLKKKRAKKK